MAQSFLATALAAAVFRSAILWIISYFVNKFDMKQPVPACCKANVDDRQRYPSLNDNQGELPGGGHNAANRDVFFTAEDLLKKRLTIPAILSSRTTSLGAVAQLGERMTGSHEANGSIPFSSTKDYKGLAIIANPFFIGSSWLGAPGVRLGAVLESRSLTSDVAMPGTQ